MITPQRSGAIHPCVVPESIIPSARSIFGVPTPSARVFQGFAGFLPVVDLDVPNRPFAIATTTALAASRQVQPPDKIIQGFPVDLRPVPLSDSLRAVSSALVRPAPQCAPSPLGSGCGLLLRPFSRFPSFRACRSSAALASASARAARSFPLAPFVCSASHDLLSCAALASDAAFASAS